MQFCPDLTWILKYVVLYTLMGIRTTWVFGVIQFDSSCVLYIPVFELFCSKNEMSTGEEIYIKVVVHLNISLVAFKQSFLLQN